MQALAVFGMGAIELVVALVGVAAFVFMIVFGVRVIRWAWHKTRLP